MSNVFYSNARAVVLEKALFGSERTKRLVEAENLDEVFKIFSEVNFGGDKAFEDKIDAEEIINRETSELLSFIKTVSPDENIKKVILYPYDFRNAEAIVKAKFLKIEYESLLSPNGVFDVKFLKEKIFEDEYGAFPKELAKALNLADAAFVEKKATGQFINSLFTKALYDELFSLKIKNGILSEILNAKVDLLNVNIALRLRDYSNAKGYFLHYGNLKAEDLQVFCEGSVEEIKTKFKFNDLYPVVEHGLNYLENGKGFSEFEIVSENYPVIMLKKYKYSSEGILPFLRYCYYKFADIANARLIAVGKAGGLSKEEISARLREHYEG